MGKNTDAEHEQKTDYQVYAHADEEARRPGNVAQTRQKIDEAQFDERGQAENSV